MELRALTQSVRGGTLVGRMDAVAERVLPGRLADRLPPSVARRWWVGAAGLVAVLSVVGFLALGGRGTEPPTAAAQAPAGAAVKTATASEGKISANLSYTGDVKAVSQVNVLPKATGRIEKLVVDVGSWVKRGDILAELDSAMLKAQVSQAKANLAAARAKLANMEAGSRAEQIAQAKANVDSARARVAALQSGRQEQIATAEAALEEAKARAETVKKGAKETDIQAAQAAVDQARAALEQTKQWPTQTEWGQALGALDQARANMQAAEAKLADVKAGAKPADIAAQQAAVEKARADVWAADDLKAIAGGSQSEATKYAAGATSTGRAEKQAAAAEAAYQAAVEKLKQMQSWPLPADLAAAQSAYDAAKAAYQAAWHRVDQMKRGPTKEDIQRAEANVAAAEARLKQLKDGPTEEDIKVVDATVARAEQALEMAKRPARAEEIAQAQSAVVVAQQQYELARNPFTEHDMELARASVQQAQAALEMAEIALAEAQVVSPIDGVVAERFLSAGALVSPQTPIVSVISSEVELVLGVEESQIGQISEGQKAEITVAAYPGKAFPAKVVLIGPAADPRSRTFTVKVRPEDHGGKLRQGMFAQVSIVTQEREKAVLVPKEAVVTRAGQSVVFVVKGEAVEQRAVKLGLRKDGMVEIVSGLQPGEEVVVSGHNDLRDGDKVRR